MIMQKSSISVQNQVSNKNSAVYNVQPLEINLILYNVLSFLPVTSLKTCRFVNRLWNTEAVLWLKKTSKTVIVHAADFLRFYYYFKDVRMLPFSKLSVSVVFSDVTTDNCKNFFSNFGAEITELHLEEDPYPSSNVTGKNRTKLRNILRLVPALKTLSLSLEANAEHFFFGAEELHEVRLVQVHCLKLRSSAPLSHQFLERLFYMIPNAKVAHLYDFAGEQNWEVFAAALKKQNIHTIHRQFDSGPTAFWRALTGQNSLRLKELSIFLNLHSRFSAALLQSYQRFLNTQAQYLETLSLQVSGNKPSLQEAIELPVMKKLTTLTLNVDLSYLDEHGEYPVAEILVPIEPHQIPNLQTVNLVNPAVFNADIFGESVFPSVQEVNLGPWSPNMSSLLLVGDIWFPCMKKLTNLRTNMRKQKYIDAESGVLKFDAMESIVNGLKNIEDLELTILLHTFHSNKNFNLTISGAQKSWRWLMSMLKHRRTLISGLETLLSWFYTTGYSLRQLTSLKRLVLVFESPHRFARIDEIGVYLTFLRMSSDLQVTFRGDFVIEDYLADKLRAHFKNIVLAPTVRGPI